MEIEISEDDYKHCLSYYDGIHTCQAVNNLRRIIKIAFDLGVEAALENPESLQDDE